ncbi:cysteine desulfurase family protein [Patescibacteria group bacterium]
MKRIYLDHAATTPLDSRVGEKMQPYFSKIFGNASSVHSFGQEADDGVEKAREQAAEFLGAKAGEIIFTSGATEGNNTVIKTVPAILKEKEGKDHIIILGIEHPCVLDSADYMKKQGFRITTLPVNKQGIVEPTTLEEAIDDKTALVSIMYANNEIGSIQPIAKLSEIAHDKGVLFHTDAVQAINYLNCQVDDLGVDYLTLSAHKFYGPKGVGLIYKRQGAPLSQFMHGGAQENHLRAGTLNVPGIVGLGAAIELAGKEQARRSKHAQKLRDKIIAGIQEKIDDVLVNGSLDQRLPNNANITFKYVEGESMLLSLDLEGVAVSTGSACSSGSLEPSHVILALGMPKEFSHGSLRFSFGQDNTAAEVDYVLEKLSPIIARLRKMSPVAPAKYHK